MKYLGCLILGMILIGVTIVTAWSFDWRSVYPWETLLLNNRRDFINWGIRRIKAPEAWKITKGKGVRIALLDTWVNKKHPDLEIKESWLNKEPECRDPHGTLMATFIAARENNNFGVVGVAPEVELYTADVFEKNGDGSFSIKSSTTIRALAWCREKKIQVINMSFEIPYNPYVHKEIKKCYDAGIIMVAAVGHDYQKSYPDYWRWGYPAIFPEVIAVTATDKNNQPLAVAKDGDWVDLAAPGVNVMTMDGEKNYVLISGTSVSAALVSGVAALVLSMPVGRYDFNKNGQWDPAEVQKKLEDTADPLFMLKSKVGAGLVNAERAVRP